MGEYVAHMNLGGHRRGTVKVYDDGDSVLARRLAAGWVSPVGTPVGAVPVGDAEKPAPRKRGAKKKPEPEVEIEVEAEVEAPVEVEESGPEVEGSGAEVEPDGEESSVQTSWTIGG